MQIKKYKNEENSYNIELINNNLILRILFARNLDLSLHLETDEIPGNEDCSISFDITKEDYDIFLLFDSLYNDIIKGNVFGKDLCLDNEENELFNYRNSFEYQKLVDKENNITWISDDNPNDTKDSLTISKLDEDTYRLTFKRNKEKIKNPYQDFSSIRIRFRNCGSKYNPFNCAFMRMYQSLQEIDDTYYQIHIEELQYIKRKK